MIPYSPLSYHFPMNGEKMVYSVSGSSLEVYHNFSDIPNGISFFTDEPVLQGSVLTENQTRICKKRAAKGSYGRLSAAPDFISINNHALLHLFVQQMEMDSFYECCGLILTL